MQIIAPDLFAEVSQLSVGACIIGIVLGVALWLLGWWQHRFWVVAILSAVAGVVGLQQGRAAGVQPLVAGLLAALAAGWMAMELAKLLAFAGGGATASLIVQSFMPTLHVPLIAFLAGGLCGVVFFRIWTIVLTSFLGATVATYAGLALGKQLLRADIQMLVDHRPGLLNIGVALATVLGVLFQARFEKWAAGSGARQKTKVMKSLSDAERNALKSVKAPGPLSRLFASKKAG